MVGSEFPVISFRDQSGGMMSAVDDALMPDNACRLSLNFRHDRVGRATQRNGYTKLGATVSSPNACQGLGWFLSSDGTKNRMVAAFGGINYAYDGASWTNIGAVNDTSRVRYENLLDLVFRVGGGAATMTWGGSVGSPFSSAQVSGAPQGTLIKAYKNKMRIAGVAGNPSRIYSSSTPDLNLNITWSATDYLDVNPNDGDVLTALEKTGTVMLLFKRDHTYRWNGYATDPEPVINVGAVSQEVVANVKGQVVFFHPSGIFITDGGSPNEVSRPIDDWIAAIPPANYPSMCAYADGDKYGLFCGNITKDGRAYTNVVLEYDTALKLWQGHSLKDAFTVFSKAKLADSTNIVLGGASDGDVHRMFSGTTDDGGPINFEKETKRLYFDGQYSTKEANDFAFYLSGATGALFEGREEDSKTLKPIGQSAGAMTIIKSKGLRGRWLSFKISGSNRNTLAEYWGFDILKSRSLGLIE